MIADLPKTIDIAFSPIERTETHMAIEIEAFVEKTDDGGFEFYDRIGAVVVRVDGDVVKDNPNAIKMTKTSDATDFRGPQYAVQIADQTPISIQSWTIQSVQVGTAAKLLEDDDLNS